MAEIKDKIVTVESLNALHDYDENTFLKKSGALTTLGITATASELNKLSGVTANTAELNILYGITATTEELNYCDGVTSNIQTQLNEKAASSHMHDYLPLGGGTLSGNLALQKISPAIMLKLNDSSLETRLYKNASDTADYGTMLADYDTNGKRDALTLRRSAGLDEKLSISVNNSSGGNDIYYIYGEHNKPLPSDIGAFSSSGGTVSGDVDISGILKVRDQQAFHYDTSTKAQTVGTNNATGGTIICCGSSAYLTVNGARLLTAAIVPRDGLSSAPNIGYADGRYNCIYLKSAANVSSDERLKRDIIDLDSESLADFVNKLNVVSYNYNDDEENADSRIGLTAQNVLQADENIAKYFVEEDDNGYYSLRPSDLVFPLIATVQKLTKEVEELKAKLS